MVMPMKSLLVLVKEAGTLETTERDPYVELLFDDEEEDVKIGASVEKQETLVPKNNAAQQNSAERQENKDLSKNVTFVPNTDIGTGFIFIKQPIAKLVDETSQLSALIEALPKIGDLDLIASSHMVGGKHRVISLRVAKKLGDENEGPYLALKVALGPGATVGQVIQWAMEVTREDKNAILHNDEEFYLLSVADDDGLPDEDFPTLDRTRDIYQFNFEEFVLIRDPDHKPKGARSLKYLKIHLPDEQYQIAEYKEHQTLNDLLETVCNKRKLDKDDFCLRLLWEKEKELIMDTKVGSLGVAEIALVALKEEQPTKQKTVVMTPFFAKEYKEYACFRKVGVRNKERILGIDGDGIKFKKKRNGATKSLRPISELVRCELGRKPGVFTLTFKGKNTTQSMESKFSEEIVEKIKFLMENA